jgi:hypothetical protein
VCVVCVMPCYEYGQVFRLRPHVKRLRRLLYLVFGIAYCVESECDVEVWSLGPSAAAPARLLDFSLLTRDLNLDLRLLSGISIIWQTISSIDAYPEKSRLTNLLHMRTPFLAAVQFVPHSQPAHLQQ